MGNAEPKKRGLLTNYGEKLFAKLKTGVQIMREPHIHTGYEIYFCPENITQHSVICGLEYEHSYPSVIISKPYTLHSMSCLPDCKTDYRRYVIYFNEQTVTEMGINLFPSDIFDGRMGILFKLTEAEAEHLEGIAKYFFDDKNPLTELEMRIMLSFFLHRLYGYSKEDGVVGVGTSSYYVQNVLRYIAEHFSEDISSAKLADIFSVSRSKLDRDFHSAIGETPKTFIESCRLTYAKKLLSTDMDMKISELAELCGFSSDNYFYRFFKKHTGKTPAEYKKGK